MQVRHAEDGHGPLIAAMDGARRGFRVKCPTSGAGLKPRATNCLAVASTCRTSNFLRTTGSSDSIGGASMFASAAFASLEIAR